MTGQLGSTESVLGAFILGGGADAPTPPAGGGADDLAPVLGLPPQMTLGRPWFGIFLVWLGSLVGRV